MVSLIGFSNSWLKKKWVNTCILNVSPIMRNVSWYVKYIFFDSPYTFLNIPYYFLVTFWELVGSTDQPHVHPSVCPSLLSTGSRVAGDIFLAFITQESPIRESHLTGGAAGVWPYVKQYFFLVEGSSPKFQKDLYRQKCRYIGPFETLDCFPPPKINMV